MICIQHGRRIVCVGAPRHILSASHLGCPAGAQICDHFNGATRMRCDARLYIYSPAPDVHICIELTVDQYRWLDGTRAAPKEALDYLGWSRWQRAS